MEEFITHLNKLMKMAEDLGYKIDEKEKWYHDSKLKLYYISEWHNQLYFAETREEAIDMFIEWFGRETSQEDYKLERKRKQMLENEVAAVEIRARKGMFWNDHYINWDLYRSHLGG